MAPVLQAEPRRGQPVGGTSGPRYLPHWSHIFPTLERSRSEKCSSNYPHAWQAIITTSATWRPLQLLVKTYSLLTILCAITAIMAQSMSKPAVSFTTEIMPDGFNSRVGTATKDRRQKEDLGGLNAKPLR